MKQTTPGISLTPIFNNKESPRKQPLFWKWSKGWAVADGPWKLVSSDNNKTIELFDNYQDRTETNDLADQNPEVVNRLQQLLADWLARCLEDTQINQ